MRSNARKTSSARRPRLVQQSVRRAAADVFEPLETRTLMSLLGVTLPANPQIQTAGAGSIQYNSSNENYSISTTDLNLVDPSGHNDLITPDSQNSQAGTVQILVSNNGNLLGGNGSQGQDLSLVGQVTVGSNTYSGVLLTGSILQFGYQFNNAGPTGVAAFDFRFHATGGLLQSLYFGGEDVGLKISGTNNTPFGSNFTSGGATEAWTTFTCSSNVKGFVGPITPLIATQASETNGGVVGSAVLSDTVTVTSTVATSGTVSFSLTQPDGTTVPEGSIPVTGNGTYNAPNSVLATEVGTYTWHASYSGTTLPPGAVASDYGTNESLTTVPASPSISTQASITNGGIVGASLTEDTATLAGGFNVGANNASITFTLTAPDGTQTTYGPVAVTGDGTYQSPAVQTTELGTYTWSASYSGNGLNNGAIDNGSNESVTTMPAPSQVVTAESASGDVVGSAVPNDTAVLTGAANLSGSILFTLTGPGNTTVYTQTVVVSGPGTYQTTNTTPAAQVGNYTWTAVYSGDALNTGSVDNGADESFSIVQASPAIATMASETAGGIVGESKLSDSALISGGDSPTGTIDFTLSEPNGSTVDLGTVVVNGNGSYSSPVVLATQVGTYTFHASYSGDSLNNGAVDNGFNESITTIAASPSISTQASESNGSVVGSAVLSDAATLSGSYQGTGTITFNLTAPDGSTTTVGTVNVNNDGTYTSPTVNASEVGTYVWRATYSGDALNNGAIDNGLNESSTTTSASPALVTNAAESSGNVVGTATLSDSATLSGGDSPGGTITFTVTQPDGTTVPAGTATVTGDGTYASSSFVATEVGTYTFHALYSGDANNSGTTDQGGVAEQEGTVPAQPYIYTQASATQNNVVGASQISDSATLGGGYNVSGGTITFAVTAPDGTTTTFNPVAVTGDGTYSSPSVLATEVGTYKWSATYSGDALNNGAIDNSGANEQNLIVQNQPAVTTLASATGNTVGATTLSDSALVSGGSSPTGTITFKLTQPDGSTITVGTATVNGDGTYNSPTVPATEAGTYTWHAVYGGDVDNRSASDNGQNESTTVYPASPTVTTNALASNQGVIGNTSLSDSATVSGGYNPTGYVYFSITTPGGSVVNDGYTAVNGDGTYTSPSFVPTQVGTYTFHAQYGGDLNNVGASDNGVNESVTVSNSSPSITTNAAETSGSVVGVATLSDSATLSGGYQPGGTITFTVTQPDGTTVPAGTATVSGDGTYASNSFVATEVGTYTFHASYSGDGSNNSAVDNGANESVTTAKSSPAVTTNAIETGGSTVGVAQLSDTATLSGGYQPGGTITFTVTQPDGTTVPAGSATVSGDGTYASSTITATEVGTYTFHASYSGNATNKGASDNGANESVSTTKASPTITTNAAESASGVVGTAVLTDSATVSGGDSPTGTVSFTVTQPDGTTVPAGTATVSGDGTYSSTGFVATEVGTYTFHASYNGNSLNNGAVDNGANESVSTTKASPAVTTNAVETSSTVGTAKLTDSATLTGGYQPGGTITFTVTQPDGTTVPAGSATVTGDGTYASSTITATEVGTYTFHASYSGNATNNGASDNGANESVSTTKAGPTVTTNAVESAGGVVGTAVLTDSATVSGGDSPTGTVTFTVTQPDGTTVSAGSAKVTGDGTYSSTGFIATEVGTYTFHASYSGDSLNNSATDNGVNESVTTVKAGPSVTTTASDTAGGVVGAATTSDSAVVAGGDAPTGSLTFTLTAPNGTVASTQTVTVNGDGTYTVPTAVAVTQVGTYTWTVNYGGDGLNNAAHDQGGSAEQVTIVKSSPGISTQASETAGGMCGSAYLTDSATITGGDHPTGTITFTVTQPSGTTVTVGSVTVNGDGTYTSANVSATQVGTYTFHATYSGDSLNNGAVDNGQNESLSTGKNTPTIVTCASESCGSVVGSALISDTATVSGGDNPTGTITFVLKAPDGTTASTQTVTINGDGSYSVPKPVTATEVGTYTWTATYGGDSLNNSVADHSGAAEQVTTIKASPNVVTTASGNGSMCGVSTTTTSDSAVLSGGYDETGSITFVLKAPDGTTASTQTVTVNGNGTYTTSAVTPTEVGTYTWTATYSGDSLNNSAHDQGGTAEQITIGAPSGTISGTKYQDLTGNGFSPDDTPLGGVTIDLYKDVNGTGVYASNDTLVATTVTASNGTYSFTNVAPGKYIVGETVPSGWVETGTPLMYAITVTAGSSSTGINFDDYQEECGCTMASTTCIYYVIDGCKTVTELSGNVQPGDEVTAYATVGPHMSDEFSLVSYVAPDSYWNANDASEQVVYDSKTVSFSTGASSQTICVGPVQIPLCDYQIDFVCGPVINTLGDTGSNATYHAENRFFDSSNGGTQQLPTTGSNISGIVFCDQNLDGTLDNCETLISGATVSLENSSGTVLETTTTGSNGSYEFSNLNPGTYTVVVSASGDTAEFSNSVNVTLPNNQNGQTNPMGDDADLNFAELCHCGAIKGCCWDDCNNDGKVDYNECGVINVCINLSGFDCLGNKVSLSCVTNNDGCYSFTGLLPGNYTITEGSCNGFTYGSNNVCGTVNGSTCGNTSGTTAFCNVVLPGCGEAGINYDFQEHCTTSDSRGAAASTAFWENSNGQALLAKLNGSPNSTALGTWLASTFPNMYSNVLVSGQYVSFANMTNSQLASFFVKSDYDVSSAKLNTQVLAAAFNCYATSSTLAGGTYASSYGFTVSSDGSGYDLINVGSNGAAFGVANNSNISILQALDATNSEAVNGVLYATSEVVSGVTYSSTSLQSMALTVYTNINTDGDIT